jgi:hypothetical protein
MPDPPPASWADPFQLEPPPRPGWDSCPTPAPIRQQLRRMVAGVLAHRPEPWAWPRPRRLLPRVRGVVRVRSKP